MGYGYSYIKMVIVAHTRYIAALATAWLEHNKRGVGTTLQGAVCEGNSVPVLLRTHTTRRRHIRLDVSYHQLLGGTLWVPKGCTAV